MKEYETIIKITDLPPNAGLRPGMTAVVKVHVNHLRDVLVVPIQAVAEKDRQHSAFVVTSQSVEPRFVSIGENNEKFVEIKQGLAEGERVTLDALERVSATTGKSKAGDRAPAKSELPAITAAGTTPLPVKAP